MTPERWAEVRRVFDAALEWPSADRAAYLQSACAGDGELLSEVESLLASHHQSEDFLAEPAADLSGLPATAEASGEFLTGYRLGAYQLQSCIGRGGMGSVWVAARVDDAYERRVAIKMVRRGMGSREILRRFRMERQVLASLDHPNIARLLDGGSAPDGMPYLVMEYVEGTRIDQYCDHRNSTITERLALFRAVCSAVEYAHRSLVVHRDLKAGNILVTAEGVPKLLDFGIAKLLRSEPFSREVTRIDQRAMTLAYSSPEQIRGDPITTAADVYSLGVLLYKLLTGVLPHEENGRTAADWQRAICEEEPRRPSLAVLDGPQTAIPQATQKLEAPGESRDKARERLKKKLAGDLDMIVAQGAAQGAAAPLRLGRAAFGGQSPYNLFDVTTSIADLVANSSAGEKGVAIYKDLSSGTSYGRDTPTSILNESGKNVLSVKFNSAGVDALNAALVAGAAQFAIGGALEKFDPKEASQYVFFNNGRFKGKPQLEITYQVDAPGAVPEPATLGLTGGSVVMVSVTARAFARRRRLHSAAKEFDRRGAAI